ncbi:MAG TPA: SUMF1/EgtB/PvdO family nonheme iron enzyme [Thermoanaerobaculia bacterium]|jgi:ergothioneine biosynthesis protein EgtB|nr:SUMF1/EgtB/PvdO family nonheme iron enzyme [Thermoanaerobaculia bacterium]
MQHAAFPDGLSRDRLIEWYRESRKVTRALFTIPTEDAYYDRPIRLRNPIVFYEGHLPAFDVNTLIKLALQREGLDSEFETLFARGIDPENEEAAKTPTDFWPSRAEVQAYGSNAHEQIIRVLCDGPIDDGRVPQRRNAEAAFTIIEHELMHQETLLYIFHELPYERKNAIAPLRSGRTPRPSSTVIKDMVRIPAGDATLGADGTAFGWDNEIPQVRVAVPEFAIDRHNVTNGDYLEFVRATGADAPHFWLQRGDEWYWRGMFDLTPLPLDCPVYVTFEEASAYAAWRGKRLPAEAEYHRAAFGTSGGDERAFPWGQELPDPSRGNFGFANWDTVPIGSYPDGISAWGVHDLIGNGWEWTSSLFEPFPGFAPMSSYPVYSADFFDEKHYVLKGASPATAPELIRRSFRNWYRPAYPYIYATFRCCA